MERHDVERWVADYVKAWRAPGTEGLANLFTPEISYLVSPWAEPITGLAALAVFWEAERTGPDEEFTFAGELVALDGRRAVVRVSVDYPPERGRRWRDLWVLHFGTGGRCAVFEEWPFTPGQDDGHA
jgi:SnoaL-like domain